MRRLGVVENIAHDGTVLVHAEFAPSRGADVRDKRNRPLGRVVKVFGPVREPFAAVRPIGPASLSLARTGAPMTYTIHDKGLSTTIGWKNKDSYGKSIPTRNRAQLYRLRKWQRRIRVSNATERNLAFALSELDRMASGMGLPRNVRETAAMVYRKAVNKNLIRGRSIEGVVAASLYAACRQCNVPRTLDEIANSSRVGRKEIGRTYRFMTRELKLKLMPTKPQDYVSRFCSELKLTGEVQSRAVEILKDAQDKELTSGRGPTGVAAAAIYISSILSNERRTQREVADVAGVTEVTIRNRYKELTEKLGIKVEL